MLIVIVILLVLIFLVLAFSRRGFAKFLAVPPGLVLGLVWLAIASTRPTAPAWPRSQS